MKENKNGRVKIENSLAIKCPEIAKQWHKSKNGKITPIQINYGTHKVFWWQCEKNPYHEWTGSVNRRTNASGGTLCPYCSGHRVNIDNCLKTLFPELAEEWDYDQNKITPFDITNGSDKKVWWKCNNGHKYCATVKSRTINKTGCPYCSYRYVSETNSLLAINP